jgi:hypothetical protein
MPKITEKLNAKAMTFGDRGEILGRNRPGMRVVGKTRRVKQIVRKPTQTSTDSVDRKIIGWVIKGGLGESVRSTVRRQLSKGIAVTYQRGNNVITKHPDGREEVVGVVKRATYQLPSGVRVIPGK